jgi:hypothetical protein
MGQLFSERSDAWLRLTLLGLGVGAVSALVAPMIYVRTPYWTGTQFEVEQPVEFDHRHHVRDDGIDCRYCHDGVERSRSAGIPPTETCTGCHAQIWRTSALLEPVRQSFLEDRPIPWKRVHRLPDFVYFDHSAHVLNGVACASCHGAVEDMPRVRQVSDLSMKFCLDCHRAEGRRPQLTNCTTCHR